MVKFFLMLEAMRTKLINIDFGFQEKIYTHALKFRNELITNFYRHKQQIIKL